MGAGGQPGNQAGPMSVIVEFRVHSADFELGRILSVRGSSSIELERVVPIQESTVLLVWIHNSSRDSLLEGIQSHRAVNSISEMDVFDDRTLVRLDWDISFDQLLEGINETGAQIIRAVGMPDTWRIELRYPDHDALSDFSDHCDEVEIQLQIERVYEPTKPDAGPWYGLTEPQYQAMMLAVETGYYDIPRGCTTKELADDLGVSDQAVTERLRRAIVALVANTLAYDWEE